MKKCDSIILKRTMFFPFFFESNVLFSYRICRFLAKFGFRNLFLRDCAVCDIHIISKIKFFYLPFLIEFMFSFKGQPYKIYQLKTLETCSTICGESWLIFRKQNVWSLNIWAYLTLQGFRQEAQGFRISWMVNANCKLN